MITNIVIVEGKALLKQNCLEIISKISNEEVQLIDILYKLYLQKRQERYNRNQNRKTALSERKLEDYPLHWFSFSLNEIAKKHNLDRLDLELMISNLVTLGVLKWEPEVEVHSAEKSDTDPDDTSLDIDIEVYDSETIRITNLGHEFVLMCKVPH